MRSQFVSLLYPTVCPLCLGELGAASGATHDAGGALPADLEDPGARAAGRCALFSDRPADHILAVTWPIEQGDRSTRRCGNACFTGLRAGSLEPQFRSCATVPLPGYQRYGGCTEDTAERGRGTQERSRLADRAGSGRWTRAGGRGKLNRMTTQEVSHVWAVVQFSLKW